MALINEAMKLVLDCIELLHGDQTEANRLKYEHLYQACKLFVSQYEYQAENESD